MENFAWGGKCTGALSPGCKACQHGRSTVIFVTGLCNATCFYCPVGLTRMFKTQAYANEKPLNTLEELIQEVKVCKSRAASLTGGDPLIEAEKCFEYAQQLKKEFGPDFYIHLYTPGREGTSVIFEKLSGVVDEIRFHPKHPEDVKNIELAMKYRWNVGIEIPATPGILNTKFFQDYIKEYAEKSKQFKKEFVFININELEISERNFTKLLKRKFISEQSQPDVGISVNGSNEEAHKIIDYISANYPLISVHFCPAGQKDGIQLPNRLLHRAHSVMLPSDLLIEDWTESGSSRGLLIRGVIRLSVTSKSEQITNEKLERIKEELTGVFKIPSDQISIDLEKKQLLTRADFLEEYADDIKRVFPEIIIGMVEEYPTDERLETSFFTF
ncbi:MAG: radical SAM protein [Candidatus Hodarchaeales archaeon]